jgi:hypothetical protein
LPSTANIDQHRIVGQKRLDIIRIIVRDGFEDTLFRGSLSSVQANLVIDEPAATALLFVWFWLEIRKLAAQVFAMTNEIRNALATCVADPPDDLVALYSSPPLDHPELGISIRPLADAIKYTRAIHERTLLGRPMGLFVLDDANDSNPFCYVTRGPTKGCILHLYHDGDTAIEYSSLAAFITALNAAINEGVFIDDLPGKNRRPKIDQDNLCNHISRLMSAETDEAECELTVLAQLLDTGRENTVRSLSEHASFFVREAAACVLAEHPNAQLVGVAESLANDRHPQVARPGKTALAAVKRAAASN